MTERRKSVLNAAQTSDDDLREVVATIAASVATLAAGFAAIVTKAETSNRVKKAGWRPEVERPYDARWILAASAGEATNTAIVPR